MEWYMVPAVPAVLDCGLGAFAVAVALLAACVPGWLAARHVLGNFAVRERRIGLGGIGPMGPGIRPRRERFTPALRMHAHRGG